MKVARLMVSITVSAAALSKSYLNLQMGRMNLGKLFRLFLLPLLVHFVYAQQPTTSLLPCDARLKHPTYQIGRKAGHGNGRVWEGWKAMKPAFHPSHTLWKSLRDYHIPMASTTG